MGSSRRRRSRWWGDRWCEGVGLVVAVLAHAAPASAAGRFGDDDGNVHEPMIEALAATGTVQGCTSTAYCPSAVATRGQMASALARALALPEATRDHFPDDDASVHEDAVNRVAEAGITAGRADGTFGVADPLERRQLATLLANALGPAEVADRFVDDDGDVHEDAIDRIAAAGITLGCGVDRFCPTDLVPSRPDGIVPRPGPRRGPPAGNHRRRVHPPPRGGRFGDRPGRRRRGVVPGRARHADGTAGGRAPRRPRP